MTGWGPGLRYRHAGLGGHSRYKHIAIYIPGMTMSHLKRGKVLADDLSSASRLHMVEKRINSTNCPLTLIDVA